MRIVFDLQALQNESRSRGIGRYVRHFFEALSKRNDVELIALLNHALPETLEAARADAAQLVGDQNVCVWHGLQECAASQPHNKKRAQLNQVIYEDFLASLEFDVLLIGSMFDGYADDTTVSLGGGGDYLRATIHYDLIPLLNPDDFFWEENYRDFYEGKLEQLSRANILFAISDATAREAQEHLPPASHRIVSIGTAIDHSIFNDKVKRDRDLVRSLGINRPYVLHLSTLDPRKNFDGLIRAFAKLPKSMHAKYQLVFAGTTHPQYAARLRTEARSAGLGEEQLVMLSGLSDEAVAQLYRQAALFCFPSFHEGFGLPALEAMASGCPTIGSNLTSIPEVIGDEKRLFDPSDTNEIARAMKRLLNDTAEAARAADEGVRRAQSFTWEAVADRFCEALKEVPPRKSHVAPPSIINSVARVVGAQTSRPSEDDAIRVAQSLSANFDTAMAFRGRPPAGKSVKWRIEGPFDSSYSLALLNRETARSLDEKGFAVSLRSMKEPGNGSVDEAYIERQPQLARMHARFLADGVGTRAVASRNNYPPLVDDMVGPVRALHHYAWEESGFPMKWVDGFNQNLTMMTCLSEHVRKIMIDNGVSVPMLVSGCGVDHWERINPEPSYRIDARGFRFLHVSSCFPRKGIETLIDAYGMAFKASDDVSLVIKTFHNPHNEVERIVAERRAERPDFPHVVTIFSDLTDEELKALYGQCDVMVGPSCAEGYGLPLAEAMLSGIPVITTSWGGQLDFCNAGNSWLVDYQFERAQSHFNLWASAWAKADQQSLVRALLAAHASSLESRAAMAARGRRQLLAEHKWSNVTDRLSVAAQTLCKLQRPPVRVGWITTWNSKCGIATYSEHLIEQMQCEVRVFSPANELTLESADSSVRSWRLSKDNSFLTEILSLNGADEIDVFVIQFNFGFYNHVDLGEFIHQARKKGKRVVLFLHATQHPGDQFGPGAENFHLRHMIPVLRSCDRLLVHSIDDLNRLKELGLIENVALFPHGVLSFDSVAGAKTRSRRRATIGTYGFALPHKGLSETVRAIHLLRERGEDIGLCMTNAQYPAPVSVDYVAELRSMIAQLGVQTLVDFCSDFLSDEEATARLRDTDLIVFPYQNTEESASGAVRYGMAMQKPVMVSPNPIFKDLSGAAFQCANATAEGIAEGILEALHEIDNKTEKASQIAANAAAWREEHAYENLGRRLSGMCLSLVHQY